MNTEINNIANFMQFAQKKRLSALSDDIASLSLNVSSEIQELRNRDLEITLDFILQEIKAA